MAIGKSASKKMLSAQAKVAKASSKRPTATQNERMKYKKNK